MDSDVKITVVVENTAGWRGTLGEHGLAFWVEAGPRRVLFDTGQGHVLLRNAEQLGVPLDSAEALVLSHGHYDHTGGLRDALNAAQSPSVYVHPAAFERKYACIDAGKAYEIGMPDMDEAAVRAQAGQLVFTKEPVEVLDGLFVTGEVPRVTEFEDTGGPFFIDSECRQPDPLVDDQAMFFDTAEGVVVLLGCAHAGVVNTLRHVRELTGGRPIRAVAGGMHLAAASEDRMTRTIAALRELDVEGLGPAHCTGAPATAALWAAFPGRCLPCNAGTRMVFETS